MPQFPLASSRYSAAAIVVVAALFAAAPTAQAQVALLVDGQPITALDIQQRSKFIELSTRKAPARQEVIDELVDEILEIREAKRYSIDPTDTDIKEAFGRVAGNMNIDSQKLTQILINGGASANTLKQKLRAQMVWSSLVRGRYKASLEIADSDVEAQLKLRDSGDAKQTGFEYVMRPILLLVPRGSPDAAYEARKREADSLRVRFADCNSGIPFARALREVAVRDSVIKSSADLPEALRGILDGTDVGRLTAPEQTDEGIQMFAVCAKKESKNDSPVAQKMREQIFEQKFGAQAKRYLATLRRSAMIEYKQQSEDTGGKTDRAGGKNRR